MSGQDRRKERELEEMRKQGLAMPERDESGQLINPHIPSYLSKTPWYYGSDQQPSLKHQRQAYHQQTNDAIGGINAVRTVEVSKTVAPVKFREGSCTNCGAMGHNRAACLEKPRAVTAKFANTTFATKDTKLSTNKLTFEAKRDRFATFTDQDWIDEQEKQKIELAEQLGKLKEIQATESKTKLENSQQSVLAQFESRQQRIQQKVHQSQTQTENQTDAGTDVAIGEGYKPKWRYLESDFDTDDEIEAIYAYTAASLGEDTDEGNASSDPVAVDSLLELSLEDRIKLNPKMAKAAKALLTNPSAPTTTKNKKSLLGLGLDASGTGVPSMRLMSDVPKYLLNLDDEAAFYDPRTHSMRENPFQMNDPRWLEYENKYGKTGVDQIKELEVFAYEFKEWTGKEINPVLNPTLVAQLKAQYDELKVQQQLDKEKVLNQLYGDIFQTQGSGQKTGSNAQQNEQISHPNKRPATNTTYAYGQDSSSSAGYLLSDPHGSYSFDGGAGMDGAAVPLDQIMMFPSARQQAQLQTQGGRAGQKPAVLGHQANHVVNSVASGDLGSGVQFIETVVEGQEEESEQKTKDGANQNQGEHQNKA